MKNITNDIIIDNLIYFLVKNIRNILYTLWIIISLLLGFSITYFIAINSDPDFFNLFVSLFGTLISTVFAGIIAAINDIPIYTYYSRMFSDYIKDKYNHI